MRPLLVGLLLVGLAACSEPATEPTTRTPAPRFVLASQTVNPSIGAGEEYTCAVKSDGTIICWGTEQTGLPVGLVASQVSVGGGHTCAIATDGSVVCWGRNDFGQATVPAGIGEVSVVSAGAWHTCARR